MHMRYALRAVGVIVVGIVLRFSVTFDFRRACAEEVHVHTVKGLLHALFTDQAPLTRARLWLACPLPALRGEGGMPCARSRRVILCEHVAYLIRRKIHPHAVRAFGVVFNIGARVAFGIGDLSFVLDKAYAGVLAEELGSECFGIGVQQCFIAEERGAGL